MEKDSPQVPVDKLRFSTSDVTKLLVFVGGMMFQYFTFKSEIHDALLQQRDNQQLIDLRLKSLEDANRVNSLRIDNWGMSPADKPKPIAITNDDVPN